MMNAADWLRMKKEMAVVRTDRSFDIEFRRDEVTLDAQEVRVEAMPTRSFRLQSDAARAANRAVVVFGACELDVAVDDRFTLDGILYRVVFISPNRDVDTQAEAVAVE
jgi:hypothetical protein